MIAYNIETIVRKRGIIVLPDNMKVLEKHRVKLTLIDLEKSDKQNGLISAIGKWNNFDEIEEILTDISSVRLKGGFGRDVSL